MKKQQSGFTLIELMIVVAIIGILAAIAIPSYMDYTARSQMSEAMTLASGPKTTVSETYAQEGAFPSDNAAAGLPAAASITGNYVDNVAVSGSGVITATMKGAGSVAAGIGGKTVTLTPTDEGGSVSWACSSNADNKYVPSACR